VPALCRRELVCLPGHPSALPAGDGRAVRLEGRTGHRSEGAAFLSETNLKEDISVEVFILAEARTDMSDFEELSGEAG
jgi:hypothetical protein